MSEPQPTTEPEAPDLPAYIADPIEKQSAATLREIAAWTEALADHREAQSIEIDADEELVEVGSGDDDDGPTTVVKKVPCGKDCGGCPHGPYEYHVHREGDGLVWEYVGPAGR